MQDTGYGDVELHHLNGYRSEGKPKGLFVLCMAPQKSAIVYYAKAVREDSIIGRYCWRRPASADRR